MEGIAPAKTTEIFTRIISNSSFRGVDSICTEESTSDSLVTSESSDSDQVGWMADVGVMESPFTWF
ncbi:hypothetical protein Sjap_018404 [Stephania japonica]|uniref:Uncharacterized protein n=1 Tax=Stephania japonica TaxID=461633 RepID=A0AAP0I7X5_9MAGN